MSKDCYCYERKDIGEIGDKKSGASDGQGIAKGGLNASILNFAVLVIPGRP